LSFEQITELKKLCKYFQQIGESKLIIGQRSAFKYAKLKIKRLFETRVNDSKKMTSNKKIKVNTNAMEMKLVKTNFLKCIYSKLDYLISALDIDDRDVGKYFPGKHFNKIQLTTISIKPERCR
jgi:hypothetical protein